jgi:ATP-dependent DNA ligase
VPTKVGFIESMECLAVTTIPEGPGWTYEIKLDGEVVALDEGGRSASQIHYYAFDVLVHKGKLLTAKPLSERRALLAKITPINEHISILRQETMHGHCARGNKARRLNVASGK